MEQECNLKHLQFRLINNQSNTYENLRDIIEELPINSKIYLISDFSDVEKLYFETFSKLRKIPTWVQKDLDCQPVLIFYKDESRESLTELSKNELIKLSLELNNNSNQKSSCCVYFDEEICNIIQSNINELTILCEPSGLDHGDAATNDDTKSFRYGSVMCT